MSLQRVQSALAGVQQALASAVVYAWEKAGEHAQFQDEIDEMLTMVRLCNELPPVPVELFEVSTMRPLHRNVVNVLSATVKKNWRDAWIDVIENKKAAQEVTFLSVADLAEELFKTRLPEIDPAYGISILRRQIQGYGTKEPITP